MNRFKVYLAAPFFTPDQNDTMDKVEVMVDRYGFEMFSPRKEGGVFNKEAPAEEREKQARAIFVGNENAMSNADFALLNLDDKDTGTAWEFGYFYGKRIPCVSYSKHGYGANIMLSQSGMAHFSDLTGLQLFLKNLQSVIKKELYNQTPEVDCDRHSFMRECFKKAIAITEDEVDTKFRGLSDE